VTSRPVKFQGVTWKPGTLFQHYPINARLQHANGGNIIGPGFELEGMAGTPITDEQIKTYLAIHRDISEWRGKEFTRHPFDSTPLPGALLEHREAKGAQTNCPNKRYDRLWAAIAAGEEADEVTREEYEELRVRMTNMEFLLTGKSGNEAVAIAKDLAAKGISPLVTRMDNTERNGDTTARSNINGHISNHGAQGGGGVTPHDHIDSKIVVKK
jgi:hypothetical protein